MSVAVKLCAYPTCTNETWDPAGLACTDHLGMLDEVPSSDWETKKVPDVQLTIESEAAPPEVETRTMADIIADPPERPPRLLEPALMIEGGLTVIAAPTKVGKTNLWLHIAWALTEGASLWGRFDAVRPLSVLMIQLELSEPTVYERLDILREQLGWSEEAQQRFAVHCGRALLLDRREGPDKVCGIIDACATPPEVVILDSYNAAVAGDPDKSSEARRALHALRTVQERTGVTWGLTAEVRKAAVGTRSRVTLDDLKGSNELAYDADAVMMLRPMDEQRRKLRMQFPAMRHIVGEAPEGLVLTRTGLTFDLSESVERTNDDDIRDVLRDYLESGGDQSWRACRDAVRAAGVKARDQAITDVRRGLLGGTA